MAKQKSMTLRTLHTPLCGRPPVFASDFDAIQYALAQGVFVDIVRAEQRLAALRADFGPACWAVWLGELARVKND